MLFQGISGMTGNGDLMPSDINPGDMIRISVWLKANNLVPDSAALYPETWAVGFTYGYFKGVGNNDGWNPIDGFPVDMQFVLPSVTSFDWTQYFIDVQVPDDPEAVAMSVRLHAYARFTGTVYWDDLKVETLLPGFLGDVNGDDNCNSTDALIILSYDVGITIPPDFLDRINAGIGDVNSDGPTNSTDALILLSFDVGIPVPFPVCDPISTPTVAIKKPYKKIK